MPIHNNQSLDVERHVGRQLRTARRVLDISQERLAGMVGVSYQQIQKYERGANRIAASRLFELAKALKVPMGYFFDGLA